MSYGRTIRTADPYAGATEDDPTILQQWCTQTLQTRRGTLRTAPDHGWDPPPLLGALTPPQRLAVAASAKAALERGRKVASAKVTLTETALGGGRIALALALEVKPRTGDAISFTHAVDDTLADDILKGI
jgi:hypothetical protein